MYYYFPKLILPPNKSSDLIKKFPIFDICQWMDLKIFISLLKLDMIVYLDFKLYGYENKINNECFVIPINRTNSERYYGERFAVCN